jgi:hypothetical protein
MTTAFTVAFSIMSAEDKTPQRGARSVTIQNKLTSRNDQQPETRRGNIQAGAV